jgi:AcrR family transcriptional regulator
MIMSRASRGTTEVRPRRRYDAPIRQQKAAETRERIVTAGSKLAHESASWDRKALTYRAVAARAGVGERTVYRHFPTVRNLHDAIMERLEEEAGIGYEDVDIHNLSDVTARVFATRKSFAAHESIEAPRDPTFVAVDERRREALIRAVSSAAPRSSERDRRAVAALLDVLWNLPAYERLVSVWDLSPDDATQALTWLIENLILAIVDDGYPPS